MKGVFLAPTHSSKTKRSKTKALAISAGHSSRMALRYESVSFRVILIHFLKWTLHRTSEDSEDDVDIDGQGDEYMIRYHDTKLLIQILKMTKILLASLNL